jgi:hypothetical protein
VTINPLQCGHGNTRRLHDLSRPSSPRYGHGTCVSARACGATASLLPCLMNLTWHCHHHSRLLYRSTLLCGGVEFDYRQWHRLSWSSTVIFIRSSIKLSKDTSLKARRLPSESFPNSPVIVSSDDTKSNLYYDRQSVGQSWCQALIWDPQPILSHSLFDYFLDSAGLLMWGALSGEKSGL